MTAIRFVHDMSMIVRVPKCISNRTQFQLNSLPFFYYWILLLHLLCSSLIFNFTVKKYSSNNNKKTTIDQKQPAQKKTIIIIMIMMLGFYRESMKFVVKYMASNANNWEYPDILTKPTKNAIKAEANTVSIYFFCFSHIKLTFNGVHLLEMSINFARKLIYFLRVQWLQ